MQLFVKTLAGKTLTVEAKADENVGTLRTRLSGQLNMSEEGMRLVYSGKQLDAARTFADYDIKADATLHLLARLQGGKRL